MYKYFPGKIFFKIDLTEIDSTPSDNLSNKVKQPCREQHPTNQ